MNIQDTFTLSDRFFQPLKNAVENATNVRSCGRFNDEDFLFAGVGRCIHAVRSGREWVQQLQHWCSDTRINVDCFFRSLRSKRRLTLAREVNENLLEQCASEPIADPFTGHEELANFALFAGDGHYHGCSTHEQKIMGKRRSNAHFFMLDMRSKGLSHLDIARPDEATMRKDEHDMRVLKRLPTKSLRMNQPTGRKVLICYDRAVIDFQQWYKWKQGNGIYILTREKANMALDVIGEPEFDRQDPRNHGVRANQMVGHSKGYAIRRIIYEDPVSGEEYSFITNEMTLPPGLIAYIYKCRWDLEKIFDELKNRLLEKKAWAKTPTSKCLQGNFLCLAHNLMVLLENRLELEEGITDEKLLKRRAKRLAQDAVKAGEAGRCPNPLIGSAKRATQRSAQFIRWLRHGLLIPTPWHTAIASLRPLMQQYIS